MLPCLTGKGIAPILMDMEVREMSNEQLTAQVELLKNLLREVLVSVDTAQLDGYNGDLSDKIEKALEE